MNFNPKRYTDGDSEMSEPKPLSVEELANIHNEPVSSAPLYWKYRLLDTIAERDRQIAELQTKLGCSSSESRRSTGPGGTR